MVLPHKLFRHPKGQAKLLFLRLLHGKALEEEAGEGQQRPPLRQVVDLIGEGHQNEEEELQKEEGVGGEPRQKGEGAGRRRPPPGGR